MLLQEIERNFEKFGKLLFEEAKPAEEAQQWGAAWGQQEGSDNGFDEFEQAPPQKGNDD